MILSWLNLYLIFFKIGLFSFGGGYVMLPLIYQHIEIHNLIPLEEFTDIVALSQMTPGPIAVNAATYIGFRNAGVLGAFFATLGVISPSIILVFFILRLLRRFKDNPIIAAVLNGVKPVTVGMIAVAAVYFVEKSLISGRFFSTDFYQMQLGFIKLPSLIIFAAIFLILTKTRINPIIITLLSGLVAVFIL
ncbi:MAG: chromate transporter [Candidatus Cloacimonetes bacterium]|nr:chromate transporter [Candidatus Cloacimonadota bacterium]